MHNVSNGEIEPVFQACLLPKFVRNLYGFGGNVHPVDFRSAGMQELEGEATRSAADIQDSFTAQVWPEQFERGMHTHIHGIPAENSREAVPEAGFVGGVFIVSTGFPT